LRGRSAARAFSSRFVAPRRDGVPSIQRWRRLTHHLQARDVGLALESPAACRGLTGAPSGKLYIGSIEPRHGAGDPARGLVAAGRP
jgi:hypothetical protein